ncbi:MAG TPA: M20/M25/M40 family metallo-hydrolase [Candidatus Acidoferrales bacterium]|nr:M20/M25/M40 family metallo-hydrolase [Candidatus Acidoferrales bacterium]
MRYRWSRHLTLFLVPFVGLAALAQAQSPQQLSGIQLQSSSAVDFTKLDVDALGWLQGLIRINTTNPPGNELAAAKYLAGILQKEGIPAEVDRSTPGRGILIARLSANPFPNPTTALLLMGHLDVAPADKSKWQVDPFGAVIQNGYLYGRGAIDDKSMLIANVAVLVALKRASVSLDRDVILLAEGDEEGGGGAGMRFAVDNYWQKIAAGFALNEGGSVTLKNGKVQYIGVQAAEKVPAKVTVTATGTASPGGVPTPNNAIISLTAAIAKIAAYKTQFRLTPVTESYFEALSQVEDPNIGKWMNQLDSPVRGDLAKEKVAAANPVWNAMLRDTIVPTKLQAGNQYTEAPPQAQATLDIGLLPGDSVDPLLLNLKQAVDDPSISFSANVSIGEAAPSSSLDGALFKAIQQATQQEFPDVPVIPMMSPEATDSAYLRLRNVQTYGLLPFPLTEEDAARAHGANERIPLDSFDKGIEYLYRIVSTFVASK